ncbi:GH3 auxin-responsive promoter family protein [Lutibacter sp.]|uniref:GH3 family domain-containing protein n=1 Tax=Lutibacter sp. TaxID=1925666 RepID=UPI0035652393
MLKLQENTLRKLLISASYTDFGKQYDFEAILKSSNIIEAFQNNIPIFDYDEIYNKWWYRLLKGDKDVTWPGSIKKFALSSGTTGSSSKQIPISHQMHLSMRKASFKSIGTFLDDLNLPNDFFNSKILMLGGATQLKQVGDLSMGDLSGILTGNMPNWMNQFYEPSIKISKESDWDKKLDKVIREAYKWDIGIVTGVPAWVQILIERIIDHYKVSSIYDIWPNFKIYIHGGVSMEPYKSYFNKLLGNDLIYLDTYTASEGFIAFQKYHRAVGMSMVMGNGIFYEFIPFNSDNFSNEGVLLDKARALNLNKITVNEEYAIILSTNAGAWRYLIGDTIKFTDISKYEIVITGRIKHFLSLCGEHLSVGNMNDAVSRLNKEMNLNIKEFTVIGGKVDSYFSHTWWLGIDKDVEREVLCDKLDSIIRSLNDDYDTERGYALKEINVNIISNNLFYGWMKTCNKIGGSNKFPRVLSNKQTASWLNFLETQNIKEG